MVTVIQTKKAGSEVISAISKMTFYESVHCGIIRCQLNEQYVWKILRRHDLNDFKTSDVKNITLAVEDQINLFSGGLLDIDQLILKKFHEIKNGNAM